MVKVNFKKNGATTVNVSIAVAILGILVLFGFGIGAAFFGLLNWGDHAPPAGAISCPAWSSAPSGYQQAFEAAAATTKKSDNTQLQPALLAAIFLSEHGDDWPTWGPEEYEKWLSIHPTYNDFKAYAPFQFELATWNGLTNNANETDMMRFDKASAAAAKFITNILSNAGIPINTTNENEVKCAGVGYNSGPNDCKDWKKGNYQGSVVVTNSYHIRTWQHFQDLINGCTGSSGGAIGPPIYSKADASFMDQEPIKSWLASRKKQTDKQLKSAGITLHWTGSWDESTGGSAGAVGKLIGIWSGREGGVYNHLVIDKQGKVYQLVPFNIKQAGSGTQKNASGQTANDFTIGIEIAGSSEDELRHNAPQLKAVEQTVADLIKDGYSVAEIGNSTTFNAQRGIFGHYQTGGGEGIAGCSSSRKTDPGKDYMKTIWQAVGAQGAECGEGKVPIRVRKGLGGAITI